MKRVHVVFKDGTVFEGNRQELVNAGCTKVLRNRNESGLMAPVRALEIYPEFIQFIRGGEEDFEETKKEIVSKETFTSYISKASKLDGVPIYSDGKGYYFKPHQNESIGSKEGEDECQISLSKRIIKRIEEKLYRPVAKFFHEVLELRPVITANMRSQNLSRHMIPDLLVSDFELGVTALSDVELIGVEIEATKYDSPVKNMEQTLNYMMNCDAAMLLYAVSRSEVDKIDQFYLDHHQRFGTGLGFIVMDDEFYSEYLDGKIDIVELSDVEILISYAPRAIKIKPSIKRSFLKELGTNNIHEMYDWKGDWLK